MNTGEYLTWQTRVAMERDDQRIRQECRDIRKHGEECTYWSGLIVWHSHNGTVTDATWTPERLDIVLAEFSRIAKQLLSLFSRQVPCNCTFHSRVTDVLALLSLCACVRLHERGHAVNVSSLQPPLASLSRALGPWRRRLHCQPRSH